MQDYRWLTPRQRLLAIFWRRPATMSWKMQAIMTLVTFGVGWIGGCLALAFLFWWPAAAPALVFVLGGTASIFLFCILWSRA